MSNTYRSNKSTCKKCLNARVRNLPTERLLFYGARARARKQGREFSIRVEDIVIPVVCPVFGVPLERAEGRTGDFSPTLDRLDSSKGYTKENIVVMSWKANRLKSNGTLEDFQRIVEFLNNACTGSG